MTSGSFVWLAGLAGDDHQECDRLARRDELATEKRSGCLSGHHRIDRFARPSGPNGSHYNDFRHDSVALRRRFRRHGSHHRLRFELRHAPDPLRHPGFVCHFLSGEEIRGVKTYSAKKDDSFCDITQNIINRDYSAAK